MIDLSFQQAEIGRLFSGHTCRSLLLLQQDPSASLRADCSVVAEVPTIELLPGFSTRASKSAVSREIDAQTLTLFDVNMLPLPFLLLSSFLSSVTT